MNYALFMRGRGRPPGTFGDPVLRLRHWHWLYEVMAIAKVSHASALDRVASTHPLYCNASRARRFESIALDGYDPGATKVTKHQSLFDFVAKAHLYDQATVGYRHVFWKHLLERNPRESPAKSWVDAQLAKVGLLKVEAVDEEHAQVLGLRVDTGTWSDDEEIRGDRAFADAADAFVTLDGMLALLILYREAVDREDDLAGSLRKALARTAGRFADELDLRDESRHTWEFLVQTRILRWNPSFGPLAEDLACAESELLSERLGRRKQAGQLDSGSPKARTQGRAERRWRRQIMMYACSLSSQRANPGAQILAVPDALKIQGATEINDWLAKNRTIIGTYVEYAVKRCMEELPESAKSALPPLIMPATIYRRRRRPTNDEEAWEVFGDGVPYDFIPVSVEKSSRSKQ